MDGTLVRPEKISNGSRVVIGESGSTINIFVKHRFNRFQKKMIKWCFGFDVFDYSDGEGV